MFIDKVKIYVKAGKGGKGCQSHYRDKLMRAPKNFKHWRGKPDGGDGGEGGKIVLKANFHLWSLLDFKYKRHFRAQDGKHGGSQKRRGENGKDCVVEVPVGTSVKDFDNQYLLGDLDADGKTLVVAKGGRGGLGNVHKREVTEGEPGQELNLDLELKLISDIGIIGFPNVGKSSLIRCISKAKSKVASFPFTTKNPILGVVDLDDKRLVVADMPGLIKDAHKGKGLGLQFLRHISRAKVLLHMVDMSGLEARDPVEDYEATNRELEFYNRKLLDKPQLLVANKMDLESSEENLKKFKAKVNKEIIPISALKKTGIGELLEALNKIFNN